MKVEITAAELSCIKYAVDVLRDAKCFANAEAVERVVIRANSPTVTLPGPDGFPNETVSAEKFSHLTTEWDG